jgi:transposase
LADHHKQALAQRDALIAEQKSIIEQLQRMLFGPKSEKLTPEQEAELAEVAGDLQEQVARSGTDSEEVLTDETESQQKQDNQPRRRRQRRPVPVGLEVITTVLEPAERTRS